MDHTLPNKEKYGAKGLAVLVLLLNKQSHSVITTSEQRQFHRGKSSAERNTLGERRREKTLEQTGHRAEKRRGEKKPELPLFVQ